MGGPDAVLLDHVSYRRGSDHQVKNMNRDTGRRCSAVLVITALATLGSPTPADDTGALTGVWRSQSGLRIQYDLHFNHNALERSEVVGNTVVGLTETGLLLRFELPEMTLARRRLFEKPLTCLGRGSAGELLAAASDGTVLALDPESLEGTAIGHFPFEPVWIGKYSTESGEVVVGITREAHWREKKDFRWIEWQFRVHVLPSGRSWSLNDQPDKILLGQDGNLWIGSDRGEFGGGVYRYDLERGKKKNLAKACSEARLEERKRFAENFGSSVKDLDWGCEGVYGFLAEPGGAVLTYGGTSHLGINHGYVGRIRDDRMSLLGEFGYGVEEDPETAGRPVFPITRILEAGEKKRVVFSYGSVFLSDTAFQEWEHVADLDIRYDPGRPNAVGSFPSVVQVHLLEVEPLHLLIATRRDGFLELKAGSVTHRPLSGQLEADHITWIGSKAGVLTAVDTQRFVGREVPWRYEAGSWSALELEPPFQPEYSEWRLDEFLTLADGSFLALYGTYASPGPHLTLHWQNDRSIVLDHRKKVAGGGIRRGLRAFETADRSVWGIEGRTLRQLDRQDGWAAVGDVPEDAAGAKMWPIASLDEATLLLDTDKEGRRLWLLTPTEDETKAVLEPIEPGKLEVYDALTLDHDQIVLATNQGVNVLDPKTKELRPPEFSLPQFAVRFLARDSAGGVWMAGDGLWMYQPEADAAHDLSGLGVLGYGPILAMATVPTEPFGVVLSIEDRGLVFLQTVPSSDQRVADPNGSD